jgi:non-specific serine/threonine protein kinase
LTQARDLAMATGSTLVHAFATQFLGQAALFEGDLARADALLREAAGRYDDVAPTHRAFCLADVGITAWFAGSYKAASAALDESLRLGEGGDPWTRSHALWGLALVRLRTGDAAAAARLGREALELMREVDDRGGVARCVEALAWAAAAQEDWDHAARLIGAADAVWRSIPAELPPPLRPDRDGYTARVQRAIGCERWDARRLEGSRLDRGTAVSLALRELRPGRPEPSPAVDATPLTRRQQEVAALVAQGLTDREIAARLVISTRTAEYHVEQILSRLGFRSRAEIAAWSAVRRGR